MKPVRGRFTQVRAAMGAKGIQVAALAMLMSGSLGASAAVVSGNVSFTASGFPTGAPADLIQGRVAYRFDNSNPFFNQADGAATGAVTLDLELLDLSYTGTWSLVATYIKALDVLAIGHGPTTVVPSVAGTSDWRFAINNVSTMPTFREFAYSSADLPGQSFVTTHGRLVEHPVDAPQAGFVLPLLGLLSAGWVRARISRVTRSRPPSRNCPGGANPCAGGTVAVSSRGHAVWSAV